MGKCNLCGQGDLIELIDFGQQPIAHHLLNDPNQDEYIHPLLLVYCPKCGLIQVNDPIPPDILYSEYHWLSSWKWNPHIPRQIELLQKLMAESGENCKIVEVGCNDGSFLEELRKHGYKHLLGVEPAKDAEQAARQRGVELYRSYFNLETAIKIVHEFGKFDLLISRQMLEHIQDLNDFKLALRETLRPGGYVLIEVPNFEFNLDVKDYSGIWEEHINYFTLNTLNLYLAEIGIKIIHRETATFSGQALFVLGRYFETNNFISPKDYLPGLMEKVSSFKECWPKFRENFHGYLEENKEGDNIGVYGAGCRACSLINFTGLDMYIDYVLDDQQEKQGKYMPGSRIPILGGERLENSNIDLCLLAVNCENEETVIGNHEGFRQKGGRFISIHPPSEHLPHFWKDIQMKR